MLFIQYYVLRQLTRIQPLGLWAILTYLLPDINWESCYIIGNSYPLTLCHMVIDCMQECGFSQVINFLTTRNNILDIFFTNRLLLITPYLALVIMKSCIYLESFTEVQLAKMPNCKILVWSRLISPQLNRLHKTLIPVFYINILWQVQLYFMG